MNPIHILAWILIGGITIIALLLLLKLAVVTASFGSRMYEHHRRHMRTRNMPPAVGQVWRQGHERLEITTVTDDYVAVRIKSFGSIASWGESLDDWNKRVRENVMYLEE